MSEWFKDQRQAFIEATFAQFGQVCRQDIMRQFGVTVTQASSDIQTYLARSDKAVRYDTSAKVYTTAPLPARPSLKPDVPTWTVILMKPDYWRGDESCAVDEVVRMWDGAPDSESAQVAAYAKLVEDFDGVGHGPDDHADPDDFAVVAIYQGHLFDMSKGDC